MGGRRRGKLPQTKVAVSMPDVLILRIEEILKRRGSWTTVADFMRQAAAETADSIESEDRGAASSDTEIEEKVVRSARVR